MNRIAITLALASVIACAAFGYEPPRHNGTYTTNGVTYAQRGGLGASDYVVTKVDISAGTMDYAELGNKPSVNGVELSGDKTAADLGLQDAIADYTTTGAVRSLVEGYGYATEGSLAAVARSATNYVDVVVGGLDIPNGQDITNAATWAAGNAYEDAVAAANAHTDASISETNDAFVAAVQAASPPVVLPQKWALANVTNANGVAVTAADVGAVKRYVTSIDGTVELLSSTNRVYGLSGEEDESSPSMMFAYISPYYHSYRYDNYYGTHYYEFDKSTSPNKISYASISLGSLWNGFGVYCDDGYGNISSVSLPYNANGYFAIESWASLSRTLNNTATNATCKAACADALEKISESKPHFAIIDGEVHIITVTP